MTYTESQRRAIEERGTSLLVSAAAGSGKTRVLTERLMRYVTEGEDIDRFLIITYTRAAAAELRSRILGRLGALAAEDPANVRLRRQQNLCYRAKIGTIHSFCTDLLRENCHHLGLSPAFRVMDADKAEAMRRSVLEKLLDERYEHIDRDAQFRLLCDTVGAGRDDRRLVETLLELHTKLRAHPDPESWAREQMDAFDPESVTDAGETIWGRELLSSAAESARDWAERMERAAEEIFAADARIAKAFGPGFSETASALRDFARAAGSGVWDRAAGFLPIPFPRIVTPRNYEDPAFAERMKALRTACKKAAGDWAETLQGSSEKLLADMRAMAPAVRSLLALTLEFDRAFDAEKRRGSELDFSDLEHYAARLLIDRESGKPTWIAAETAQRFTEIMVDEYQDVNAVQERIFTAVSRAGRNLFLVGDVKQSIYRFRLADLTIFLDKYRRFAPPECDGGQRVLLRENFRSRKSVLNAANHVFSSIMSEALGELDYDEDAALAFGAAYYPEGTEKAAAFYVIDPESAVGDDEDTPEKAELEARFVAGKIRALMDAETPVTDNGGTRKCRWGDFALLLRSPSAHGGVFHRVLEQEGIPVQSRQGGGFFTSLEVTVTINLLSVVDNPHADVPLISVLRSPAFGFDGDALAEIRAASRENDYYGAVCAAAEAGNERCAAFLETLDTLRAAAPDLGADELVWRVYNETNLFALCAAMRDADARRGNLMHLFEYARLFESGVGHGLHRFIRWLLHLAERGEEPAGGGGDDAVKIMSIHKSKGLEFPFVFLSDLSHRFNKSDASAPVLLHTRLGLGPKRTDAARGIEYPTLARRAIARRLVTETLSEEMRVLYVAMTRAREQLFLTCTWKNAGEAIEKLRLGLSDSIAPDILRTAASPAQWLACCASEEEGPLRLQIVRKVESPDSAAIQPSQAEAPSGEATTLLQKSLDFVYPYAQAETLPSKLTATGLTGRADDEERARDAAGLLPEDDPVFRRPLLGQPGKANAAQRGTATHTALQHLDLSLAGSEAALQRELRRMTEKGLLTPEQAACADTGALLRFARSPLCKRILAADDCRREFRFTLLAEAADYFDAPAGEKLLLQGVVDCFIVEDGAITIIDYKTDRVTLDEVPVRAAHYAPQLAAYAEALGRICALPVRQCLLYFLTPGVEYPL